MNSKCSALRNIAELAFNKLLHIDVSVEVSALDKGSWEESTACVVCLIDVLEIDSSCDLRDEFWSKSLFSQLLVNTEEVDLGHPVLLLPRSDLDRNARDEPKELVILPAPHA